MPRLVIVIAKSTVVAVAGLGALMASRRRWQLAGDASRQLRR
ncbi:hypothetical protein J2X16_001417 [Pelomonas aquatica]|uniref:Uncharacterized protein n=1 Tax=Pelomonas aquatica TaxID=431058 RepID=A0ABU1Z6K4_9BURK|nr:hypothetical protein [Pelomonas aquatica]MDR7296078.1 hypothetical protein [Pelomonas aquatica]